jgi:hypothetical protein
MPTHVSEPIPSNIWTLLAPEALVADVLEELVVALAEVDEDEPLDVALAGRLESAASAVMEADRPVTFVQEEGAAIVPATKFTAAHWKKSAWFLTRVFGHPEAYLVQDSIWRILDHSNYSFGTDPGDRHRDAWLTEGTEASLLNARQ